MTEIIIALVFIIILGLTFKGKPFENPKSTVPDKKIFQHFEAVPSLFVNNSERMFFQMMVRSLPVGYILIVKPRLEDVIRVKKGLADKKLRWQLRSRIKSRHLDFAVMTWDGLPIMGIEIDGRSHNAKSAAAGDILKNGLFDTVGLPLLRIKTGEDFAAHIAQITQTLKSL